MNIREVESAKLIRKTKLGTNPIVEIGNYQLGRSYFVSKMREDESNWFSNWEDELPSPDELIPLSQSLISPDLALAFNIQNPRIHPIPNTSAEFDSSDFVGRGPEEPARTLKRPRLVWTPHLHKRFVDAVAHLGMKNAVPKTIMQLMSVEGLTRENVASHLQKYRLYLKRMQGGAAAGGDPATDRLFASSPVPPHFLTAMQLPHHRHTQFPAQFGENGHFALQSNGQMENPFSLGRQQQAPSFVHDVDSGNGRRVLTLFPTGED